MVLSAPNETIRARVRQSAVTRRQDGLCTLNFQAMGTLCRISLVEPAVGSVPLCLEKILNAVADFEARYSRFLDSSLVSQINAAAGRDWVAIDDEMERLLQLCGELSFFSRGAFDPTALPLMRLWNWKTHPVVLPTEAQIAAARALVGWNKVQGRRGAVFLPKPGMCLDFGGIGKEYAVDLTLALAAQAGVEHILVDYGQDIRVQGRPPGRPAWHVGLEDPVQPGTCWGSVAVTNHAVAASGDYLRCFHHEGKRYGHIIDPRTGYPVQNGCLSVHVVAPTCTVAGILSTTAFVLGPQEGFALIQGHYGASGAILTATQKHLTTRFHEHFVH